ncbi:MAG: DNA polymerase III subunit chi [Gammaproteobacteria bacterium]
MTQIDFYILNDTAGDRFVCKLAAKAWRRKHRIYIHTGSDLQAAAIDDLLWTFRDISFLPHAQVDDNPQPETPILVGCGEPPHGFDQILINLADPAPEFFPRFQRVLEVVGAEQRQQARARYRYYQERGYSPSTHEIQSDDESGE